MPGTPREPRRTDHAYDKTDALLLGAGAVLVLIGLALAADSWRSSSTAPEPSALTASADSARGRFLRRERDSAPTTTPDSGVTIPTVLPAESAAAVLGASAATAMTGVTAPASGSTAPAVVGAVTAGTGATAPKASTQLKPAAPGASIATAAAGTTAAPQTPAPRTVAPGVTAPAGAATAPTKVLSTMTAVPGTTSGASASAVPRPAPPPAPVAVPPAASAPPGAAPAATDGWSLQLGAFGSRANAEKVVAAAALQGVESRIVESGTLLKVRTSSFASRSEAEAAATKLRASGLSPVLLKPGS